MNGRDACCAASSALRPGAAGVLTARAGRNVPSSEVRAAVPKNACEACCVDSALCHGFCSQILLQVRGPEARVGYAWDGSCRSSQPRQSASTFLAAARAWSPKRYRRSVSNTRPPIGIANRCAIPGMGCSIRSSRPGCCGGLTISTTPLSSGNPADVAKHAPALASANLPVDQPGGPRHPCRSTSRKGPRLLTAGHRSVGDRAAWRSACIRAQGPVVVCATHRRCHPQFILKARGMPNASRTEAHAPSQSFESACEN